MISSRSSAFAVGIAFLVALTAFFNVLPERKILSQFAIYDDGVEAKAGNNRSIITLPDTSAVLEKIRYQFSGVIANNSSEERSSPDRTTAANATSTHVINADETITDGSTPQKLSNDANNSTNGANVTLSSVATAPAGPSMNATNTNVTASLTDNATTPEETVSLANATNRTGIEIPVVVSLSGELGNHMFEIGAAHVMKWEVAETMNVDLRLSYRGQNYGKSHKTARDYRTCFPAFRDTIFNEHNTDAFNALQREQDSMYGKDAFMIDSAFDVAAVQRDRFVQKLKAAISATASTTHNSTLQKGSNLRIPFLMTRGVWQNLRLLSEHRDRLRELFRLNETTCCNEIPSPNETVIHVRGFVTEMPRRGKSLGFQELEPDRMANELLGHLNSGDSVAIISRFADRVEAHVTEMEKRGLRVRVISGQGGVQDFCFLTKAKRGVAGISKSTFFSLAAFLGDAERIDVYAMHTPHTKRNYRGELNQAEYMYPNTTDYLNYHLHHFPPAGSTA